MSEIKPDNLLLIQKCLEFYADEKNYEKLIQIDRGAFAKNILNIIEKINIENNIELDQFQNKEVDISEFFKNLDAIKSQNL